MAIIYFLAIGLTIALLTMVAARAFEGWKAVRDWKSHPPPKGEEGYDNRQNQKRSDHDM